jgi:hypothetical protein
LFNMGGSYTSATGAVVLLEDAPVSIKRSLVGPYPFTPGFGREAMVLKASADLAAARRQPVSEAIKTLTGTLATLKGWVKWYGAAVTKAEADEVIKDVAKAREDLKHGGGGLVFHSTATAFAQQTGVAGPASSSATSRRWGAGLKHGARKGFGYSMGKMSKRGRF